MRCLLILFMVCVCAGCQNTASTHHHVPKITNHQFSIKPVESPKQIFELNSDIEFKVNKFFQRHGNSVRNTQALLEYLFTDTNQEITYQQHANLTATQAFYNQNANCLSLSILAYSIAEHMGFKTQFRKVYIPEYWDRTNGFSLLTGHINLTVEEHEFNKKNVTTVFTEPKRVLIDFDPYSRQSHFKAKSISKARVTAMFYTNKGAIALVKGEYDQAFSYLKAAIETDHKFSSAWGNLAVLMRLNGDLSQAETFYNFALNLEPNNNTVKGNLAILYQLTHRPDEAKLIAEQLHQSRMGNPYYHIALGNEALENQELKKAKLAFRRAKQLDKHIHHAYFGLAQIAVIESQVDTAESYLKRAYKAAQFEHDKEKYKTKLSLLRGISFNESN